MMRGQSVGVKPKAPSDLVATLTGSGKNRTAQLRWTDNSANETSFTIERSTNPTFTGTLATFSVGAEVTTFTQVVGSTNYFYRVYAVNTVGDTFNYGGGTFPTLTLKSAYASTAPIGAPTNLAATAVRQGNQARVTLTWTDNAGNETGFLVQRASDSGFTANVVSSTVGANVTTMAQNVNRTTTYHYRVLAFNVVGASGWSNTASVTTP